MKISLGLPLILLFSALVLPACVHLHPDFMAHAADGDSGFRHHDFEDDDDRDGLEQHIRDLEETLQRLEQELGRVHRELEEAHQEMMERPQRTHG